MEISRIHISCQIINISSDESIMSILYQNLSRSFVPHKDISVVRMYEILTYFKQNVEEKMIPKHMLHMRSIFGTRYARKN